MSAPSTPPTLLTAVAEHLNTPAQPSTLVRHHGTQVWLLPHAQAIVRIMAPTHTDAAQRALALTRWLHDHGLPVTEPLVGTLFTEQDQIATVWRYYPQPDERRPTPAELGHLLARLHQIGDPPPALSADLPLFTPLASLTATLERTRTLPPELTADLKARIKDLLGAYDTLTFPLGEGLIHGDAWLGNVLYNNEGTPILGDWDECARGPRELDLANLWQGRRFGRTPAELEAFSQAYGYDLSSWEGMDVLTRIRDLHTLGSYVRAADRGDTAARDQLLHRIATLDETTTSWITR
ncbi:phosphotransferase enzyme family protein [Nocardiopsis metallicus]|uniref:Aminoglycoside phosphotransferase (APT) family kinase protein n=1 Tax=Nocardiopsis metallicus TaxID=179819 RepID=A0A840WEX5_9ACTN|nr:phosphotransferase [Nocardiopsis metallicus]MBB5494782.1 aminoglycoside phosphotransferase (APT) family kinase protein [Nocardiopsis metallicus]